MYLSILLSLLSASRGQIVWAEDNCNTENTDLRVVWGEPTDAICCNATKTDKGTPIGIDALMCASKEDETLCENIEDMEVEECMVKMCEKEDKCIWRDGRCKPNRDIENNVCCPPGEVIRNCQHILRGQCPPDWRIPGQCCPPPYDKYRRRLETGEENTVCCNAPCTAIELAWAGNETRGIEPNEQCNADLSPNCGPAKRSALMSGGMNSFLLSQLMDFPTSGSSSFGQSNPFFGSVDSLLGGQFGMMMGLMNDMGVSESEPVEEITVDDFFNSLIEALDNDKDVFEYQSDTFSHPYFGKMTMDGFNPLTGGLLGLMMGQTGGFNYPDPYQFINPMTSYNPYGYQGSQYSYSSQFGFPESSYQQQPTDPFNLPGTYNYKYNKMYGYNSQPQSQNPSYYYNYQQQYPSNYQQQPTQNFVSQGSSQTSFAGTQSSSINAGSQAQSGSSQESSQQSSTPTQQPVDQAQTYSNGEYGGYQGTNQNNYNQYQYPYNYNYYHNQNYDSDYYGYGNNNGN